MDGLKLEYFPSGCSDLNAIEELWRWMKHAVLGVRHVRFRSMCNDTYG